MPSVLTLQSKLFKILELYKILLKILHVVFKDISLEIHLVDSGFYVFKGRTQSQGCLTYIA